jgi:autophagy-related protein 2
MMDDDLPSNVEYIDDSYGTAGGFRALDDLEDEEFAVTGPVTLGESDNLTVLAGGETIRLLTSEPLHFEEHHFDTLPPETSDLYVP